ncbi:hypothetical protein GQR58_025931 [Nymphon striatum]|nr:hypothetical protein GQR58_025931 [Nymphon striatum]
MQIIHLKQGPVEAEAKRGGSVVNIAVLGLKDPAAKNWRTSHVLHFTRTFHPTLSSNSEVYPLRSSLEILRVVGNAIGSYCSMKSSLKLNLLHRIETASGSTAPRAPNYIGKTEKNCYMENKLGVLRISLSSLPSRYRH